jgi:hypothetical protein
MTHTLLENLNKFYIILIKYFFHVQIYVTVN